MIYPDGREVCDTARPQGLELYRSRKGTMFARQGGRCAICGDRNLRLHQPEFDHRTGRGMGAAKRDDRIWTPEGQPMNALVCHSCNSAKGSQVFEYPFQTKMTRQEYESSMLGQIEGL